MCVANHPQKEKEKEKELHFPFRSANKSGGGISLVDVIHGVVCVSYSSQSGFDSTILWNPAICKYVPLPRLPSPTTSGCRARFGASLIGFGFSTSDNEFRVVRVWMPNAASVESRLPPRWYEVVYVTPSSSSSRGGVRSRGADILKRCSLYEGSKTSCFVNGSIHWIIYALNRRRSVLMFDCKNESFRIVDLTRGRLYSMPQPPFFKGNSASPQKTRLMEYAGMLSVLVDWCLDRQPAATGEFGACTEDPSCFRGRPLHTELWVMEEHGVVDSWTRLYRFQNSSCCGGFLYHRFDVCLDSFVELAPYGPRQWSDFTLALEKTKHLSSHHRVQSFYEHKYDEIVSAHVYDQSMFLIDHPKAHSYSDQDQEQIVCKELRSVAGAESKPWWCVFNCLLGRPVQRVPHTAARYPTARS